MGNLFLRGNSALGDMKRTILGTLDSIRNYIVAEASESEIFALSVVREVFANTSTAQVQQAIQAVAENKTNERKHA